MQSWDGIFVAVFNCNLHSRVFGVDFDTSELEIITREFFRGIYKNRCTPDGALDLTANFQHQFWHGMFFISVFSLYDGPVTGDRTSKAKRRGLRALLFGVSDADNTKMGAKLFFLSKSFGRFRSPPPRCPALYTTRMDGCGDEHACGYVV